MIQITKHRKLLQFRTYIRNSKIIHMIRRKVHLLDQPAYNKNDPNYNEEYEF